MKVHDSLIGAVLLVLSLAVLWHVRAFPPVPGQPYGSALFPTLAAAGLAIASLLLVIQGVLGRRDPPAAMPLEGQPDAGDPPSARPALLPILIVVVTMGLYIGLVDWLGFIICGTAMLVVLLALFQVRPLYILPVALLATLVIHTGFYRLLRVPLPWGVLQPVAW